MHNSAPFTREWVWVLDGELECKDEAKKTALTVILETPPELSDEDDVEVEGIAHVQHAVIFKCHGCTQDVKYRRTF